MSEPIDLEAVEIQWKKRLGTVEVLGTSCVGTSGCEQVLALVAECRVLRQVQAAAEALLAAWDEPWSDRRTAFERLGEPASDLRAVLAAARGEEKPA